MFDVWRQFFMYKIKNLQLKNYLKAIKILSLSIEDNPKNHHSYNNIGLAYNEIKDFNEAIKNYEICIKLKPNFPDAYINKGISLKEIGNYEEALKDFKTVLKLSPSNARLILILEIYKRNKKNMMKL